MLTSLATALAMYSRIPVPSRWFGEGRARYSICFFPVVGAVIGALAYGLFRLGAFLSGSGVHTGLIFPALLTVLPLLMTGGIHFDGFLDTWDARASWKSREEKLEILKDSRCGAFAVMHGGILLLMTFGCFTALPEEGMRVVAAGYLLSRSLSGLGVVVLPKARKDGMLRREADAQPGCAKYILLAECVAAAALMVLLSPLAGAVSAGAAVLVFLWYRRVAVREFGGTTGDLAGWFLELCELAVLAAAVLATAVLTGMRL